MELSEKETELIRKFFDDELSDAELGELKGLENSSADFKEELLTQKAIISSLKAQEKARKMEAVKKLVSAKKIEIEDLGDENDGVSETPVIPLSKPDSINENNRDSGFSFYYKIAAAVVVLIVAGIVLMNQFSGTTPDELYLSYYEPLDASVSTRSYTEDGDVTSLEHYQKGDYEAAVSSLKASIQKPEALPSLKVYLGISQIETGRFNEAVETFKEIYADNPNDFTGQHAEWYLALIQLKKDPVKAKQQFLKIAEQGGVNEREAEGVLEK